MIAQIQPDNVHMVNALLQIATLLLVAICLKLARDLVAKLTEVQKDVGEVKEESKRELVRRVEEVKKDVEEVKKEVKHKNGI